MSAKDYLPFPHGIRPAIPVDATEVQEQGGDTDGEDKVIKYIDNPTTVVALLPLSDAEKTGYTISGIAGGTGTGGLHDESISQASFQA